MRTLISPKDLASAIGVSESSMKRWADEGLLNATRTAGGHRRIALAEAVRFIRQIGASVVQPSYLGLTDLEHLPADQVALPPGEQLYQALEHGDAAAARGVLQALYLGGMDIASICDGPLRESLVRLGELWLHQEWGIAVEHRATDICIQGVNQLRWMQPPSKEHAPVAIGGAADADPYLLPSLMASCVACEAGFRDINLGARTPLPVLERAAMQYGARLVWVAVTWHPNVKQVRDELLQVGERLRSRGVSVVVGGRALAEVGPLSAPGIVSVASMGEFAAFAKGVRTIADAAIAPSRPVRA